MGLKLTIQKKLISLFLVLSLVPMAVVSILAYNNSQSTIKQNIGTKFEEIAFHAMDKIDRLLFFSKEDIKAWAATYVMQEVMTNDKDGRIIKTLSRLKRAYGIYSGIFCINTKGKIIASSELTRLGEDVSDEPWFKKVLNTSELHISDLEYDKIVSGFSVKYTVPIFASDDETQVIGFLSSSFNWSELFDITNSIQIYEEWQSESGYTLLINSKGGVISGPGFILAEEAEERELSNRNLLSQGYKSAQLGVKGESGFLIETSHSGKEFLTGYAGSLGYRDFEGLGWALLIMQDTKEAFMPVIKLRNQFVIISLGVGTIVLILAIFISRGISIPIRKLTITANKIAEGNYSHKTEIKSRDEIGSLTTNFYKMADGLTKEITNRKTAETYIRSIINHMVDGLIATDLNGVIKLYNKAAEEMFGYKSEEVMGQNFKMFVPSSQYDTYISKYLRTGNDKIISKGPHEVTGLHRNGNTFPMLIATGEMRSENQHTIISIVRDITKQKQMEQELRTSNRMASLWRVTQGVFHEILNPVNIISAHTQLLLMEAEKGSKTEDDLKKIQGEIDHIVSISDAMLRFSRNEERDVEEVEINSLLENTLSLIVPVLKLKGVKIKKRFEEELPEIMANSDELRQVFTCMIANAEDAMPEGGTLTITTQSIQKNVDAFVEIRFKDTGGGISKQDIDKVFEPFYSTKQDKVVGVGLSLSTSYGIIENHGGIMSVESEEGKGATVTVDLPAKT